MRLDWRSTIWEGDLKVISGGQFFSSAALVFHVS
jgi:hypothetical protein